MPKIKIQMSSKLKRVSVNLAKLKISRVSDNTYNDENQNVMIARKTHHCN